MALSKISEMGGQVIIGDYSDEFIVPAKGDGTVKPGNPCYINAAGQAVQTDKDAVDLFLGFVLPSHETDVDAVVTSGANCSVVIPKSGHLYATFIVDLNLSGTGIPLMFTTTAGSLGVAAGIEVDVCAKTYRYLDGDTVGIIIWGI